MTRRNFSAKIKAAAFERAQGRCQRCLTKLLFVRPHYDHITPDGLGGEPTLENCQVLCEVCHREKTGTRDVPMIAKADRLHKKHIGAKKPKRPMPGSRASGWKMTFRNGAVKR